MTLGYPIELQKLIELAFIISFILFFVERRNMPATVISISWIKNNESLSKKYCIFEVSMYLLLDFVGNLEIGGRNYKSFFI